MTKPNVIDGYVHSVTCRLVASDGKEPCDCHPLDTRTAMRAGDVLRVFAPLPPEEAEALRPFYNCQRAIMTKRRKLTDAEKDAIIARQGGVCPGLPGMGIKCGKPVTRDSAEFDHIEQRVFTGSDAIDEFQALCRGERTSCASIKTNGKPGAGSAGSDANKRAKARKARHRQAFHNFRMAVKTVGEHEAAAMYPEVARLLRQRGRKRKITSRNNLRRRG
jgi:hypothetical protein